jgi:hypothetical protein
MEARRQRIAVVVDGALEEADEGGSLVVGEVEHHSDTSGLACGATFL